jgi:host factor-I protein
MNRDRPGPPAPPGAHFERGAPGIQDGFLNHLRRERAVVTVLLTSGAKLTGRIKSFDRYALLLESEGQEQLLFKHAIATVTPAPPVGAPQG